MKTTPTNNPKKIYFINFNICCLSLCNKKSERTSTSQVLYKKKTN